MLANGYLMNHDEGHECLRWDLSLLITRDVSLGLLMKYDYKVAWSCQTKSIWDIGLIRYSVYLGSRNINIDLYKGDKIYFSWSI